MFKKRTFVIFFVLLNCKIYSQACCSAGTPLLGSLEISSSKANNLQVGLTYDYNSLQSVYEGSSELDDNTRERSTQSLLLETSYGLTKRWAVTALISFVNQNRTIRAFNNNENEVSTNGIGDVVLLMKYNIKTSDILDQTDISVGGGLKFPTGKAGLLTNGILLPADMQPGSGSLDFLLWGYYSKGFVPIIPVNIIANVSYKINSSHNRFAGSEAGYKFGNELIFSAGVGYRTDTILDFSLFFRLRNTTKDIFDNEEVPNTGGTWLYIIPGINFKITDNFTTRLTGQLPIYRSLQGTQLTTSYTASVSLFYSYSFLNNF